MLFKEYFFLQLLRQPNYTKKFRQRHKNQNNKERENRKTVWIWEKKLSQKLLKNDYSNIFLNWKTYNVLIENRDESQYNDIKLQMVVHNSTSQ